MRGESSVLQVSSTMAAELNVNKLSRWKHSSYGNKIIKAMEYKKDQKIKIKIISEADWRYALARYTKEDLENLKYFAA